MRIEMRGNVLNSKSELTRCRIPRLIIDESWKKEWDKNKEDEAERQKQWEEMGENGEKVIGDKNAKRERVSDKGKEKKKGRRKKLKYQVMGEEWGLETIVEGRVQEDGHLERQQEQQKQGERHTKMVNKNTVQTKMKVLQGVDWICAEIVRDVRERTWLTLMMRQSDREREEEADIECEKEKQRQRQENIEMEKWQAELEEGDLGNEEEWD